MKSIIKLMVCAAFAAAPIGAIAANLPAPPVSSPDQPANGVTMQSVQQQFGAPVKKVPAIGDPPITRWVYATFIVYFERNRVLHTVSREQPFHDAPPAPEVHHLVSGSRNNAS